MKRYTLVATTISLFLCTHTNSMDKRSTSQDITAFKIFLAQKFNSTGAIDGTSTMDYHNIPTNFPEVDWNILVDCKSDILNELKKLNIENRTGKDIFIGMLQGIIQQAIASENPGFKGKMIQDVYQTYLQDVLRIASEIFGR